MEVCLERCAGLDVHQASVVCCVLIGVPGRKPQKLLRNFGTTTRELETLRTWLAEHGVTHLGMDSTGVYWKPVYAVLEGHVGQHHGPAYRLHAHHICQYLDTWRRRLADIDGLLERNEVGQLLLSVEPRGSPDIDGTGPQTAARIIAAVGDPARFKSAAAFAANVGVVPGLKQSGKNGGRRAACAPMGNACLRRALWMPVVGAVRRNAWLKPLYYGLFTRGKPHKLAPVAALPKLLHAAYSVTKNRKLFTIKLTET